MPASSSAHLAPSGDTTSAVPPPVVLLHGVGVGRRSMAPLAAVLSAVGRQVLVLDRPGYGPAPSDPASSVEEQAGWLVGSLGGLADGPVDLVGVSGGATVGLAAAIAAPSTFRRVVLHEPLVGPLAPELHDAIVASAGTLAADPTIDGLLAFVGRLGGVATMQRLDVDLLADLVAADATVRAEVPTFTDFAPTLDDIARTRTVDLVVTVGGNRPAPERRQAADVLALHAGAEVREIAKAGHLAQIDDPDGLAVVVVASPTWSTS